MGPDQPPSPPPHPPRTDLARTDAAGRPAQAAYAAMEYLVLEPFAHASLHVRLRLVHRGRGCPDGCDVCPAVLLRHVQWAVDKLHKHLRTGPPRTREGVVVRDWQLVLDAVTSPVQSGARLADVRRGLLERIPEDDPLLPVALALGAQLGLRSRAKGPRLMKDIVGDLRVSVLAQQQGWAAKPRRDLAARADLRRAGEAHPAGSRLLAAILMRLEWGDPDAFEKELATAGP